MHIPCLLFIYSNVMSGSVNLTNTNLKKEGNVQRQLKNKRNGGTLQTSRKSWLSDTVHLGNGFSWRMDRGRSTNICECVLHGPHSTSSYWGGKYEYESNSLVQWHVPRSGGEAKPAVGDRAPRYRTVPTTRRGGAIYLRCRNFGNGVRFRLWFLRSLTEPLIKITFTLHLYYIYIIFILYLY